MTITRRQYELATYLVATNSAYSQAGWGYSALVIGMFGSLVAILVYRYRRIFNRVQRQQAKWVVFGAATAVLGFVATLSVAELTGSGHNQASPIFTMIGNTVLTLFLLLIPLSIGFAILRSRLWEIDIIINRSLVYGTLTVALVMMYAGSVLALMKFANRMEE